MSPTAVPRRSEPGAWLARTASFRARCPDPRAAAGNGRGAGGHDAFGDLFQIAATAAGCRERDGEPIRNPRAFLRQVIIDQRKPRLRSERRHPATRRRDRRADRGRGGNGHQRDRRPAPLGQRAGRAAQGRRVVTPCCSRVERRARTVWAMRFSRDARGRGASPRSASPTASTPGLLQRANTAGSTASSGLPCRRLVPGLCGEVRPGSPRTGPLPVTLTTHRPPRHLPSCRAAYETFTRLHPSGA